MMFQEALELVNNGKRVRYKNEQWYLTAYSCDGEAYRIKIMPVSSSDSYPSNLGMFHINSNDWGIMPEPENMPVSELLRELEPFNNGNIFFRELKRRYEKNDNTENCCGKCSDK